MMMYEYGDRKCSYQVTIDVDILAAIPAIILLNDESRSLCSE